MSSYKIVLFGTPGETTRRLVTESLRRGHTVTVVVPDEKEFTLKHSNLKVVSGDVCKKEEVEKYAVGQDAAICAHEPEPDNLHGYVDTTRGVIDGVKGAGVHSLIWAAHPFGQPAEKAAKENDEFKPIVKAQQEALKLFQQEKDLQWGYAHSPELRNEKMGNHILFTRPDGQSRIPVKEYAATLIDEAEKGEVELYHHGETAGREY